MSKMKGESVWNRAFVCCMLCQVCSGIGSFMVNTLISSYASLLGAGASLVGVLTGLYFGVSVLMRPVTGPAIVRMDKKVLLVVTYSIGAVVNFCYGAFNSLHIFIIARMFHGLQFSLMGTLLITIAGDSLPRDKMGSGLGLFGISAAVSTAIGPSIGLAVRDWGTRSFGTMGGYKAIFYCAAILATLSLVPCLMIETKKRTKEELSSVGAWYKNIIALPSVPSAVCNMFFAMAYSVYSAYMVPYAAEKGFAGISLFFTIYACVMLVSRPIAGKLTDKYGSPAVIYPSALFFAVSFVLMWSAKSIFIVYVSAIFAALGYGASFPAFQANCLRSVPAVRRGVASNTNYFGIDLGNFLGPTLGGIVISAFAGTGRAYSTMYLFGVVPVFLAVVVLTATKDYIKRGIAAAAAAES